MVSCFGGPLGLRKYCARTTGRSVRRPASQRVICAKGDGVGTARPASQRVIGVDADCRCRLDTYMNTSTT